MTTTDDNASDDYNSSIPTATKFVAGAHESLKKFLGPFSRVIFCFALSPFSPPPLVPPWMC